MNCSILGLRAVTYSVNGPESREREDPVDGTKAERTKSGLEGGHAGIDKDGGGVKGNDVDTAHLLGNHDNESSNVGTANSGNGEELSESSDVVALAHEIPLNVELSADVVHVAGALDGVVSELDHGLPSLGVAVLLHQPTRRLGAEIDEAHERNSGDEWSAEHESPVDIGDAEDGEVEGGSEKDTKGRPHLPGHDEGTTD